MIIDGIAYRIDVQQTPSGLFAATSPDIKGLLVVEKSWAALEHVVPSIVRHLLAARAEAAAI